MSHDFSATLRAHGRDVRPRSIATLQVNVGKLCNQACLHCHVDASPKRTEAMGRDVAEACIDVLRREPRIAVLDITGGAPELNANFAWLVAEARRLGRHVTVRHNLTVQLDGNPVSGESLEHLPRFFAEHQCEVVCSLPYYSAYFTDRQRGRGVFEKSIEALRRLNAVGYGDPATGLTLNLVYNPAGAFLPGAQASLEADFRRELARRFAVVFNSLFVLTNMPIHRFRDDLVRHDGYETYMAKLVGAFNPAAADSVMCRSMISVDYDGTLSDCDFNQMLGMRVGPSAPSSIFDFDYDRLLEREITTAEHCFGCTAGAGSSCGGAIA
jgi:radical SAM/Cys-rich protein